MKIGIVTTSYPRFAGDPAGNFVEGHARALAALGHDVTVIAARDHDDAPHRADAPRRADVSQRGDAARRTDVSQRAGVSQRGDAPLRADVSQRGDGPHRIAAAPAVATSRAIEVHRVDGAGLFYRGGAPDLLEHAGARGLVASAHFTARLAAAVARHASRWDAIVAHWLVPSAVAALPSRVPLLAIAHGGDVHTLRRLRLLGPTLALLRMRRARLVFVSEQLRALAGVRDALVQPMGIELERFRALRRTPVDPPTILVASRLVPLKGVDVAIAAMRHVRTNPRLVIAGDGPERDALAARASDGSDRVTLLGAVDTARRDQLLERASVVVVPSRVLATGRTEGTPLIALEALAAGVPVVASEVGGLGALPAVRLVRPDDPRELAAAIDEAVAHPTPEAELRRAADPYGWPSVAQRLLAVL